MVEHPELLAQLAKSLRELADIIGIIRKNVLSGWGFKRDLQRMRRLKKYEKLLEALRKLHRTPIGFLYDIPTPDGPKDLDQLTDEDFANAEVVGTVASEASGFLTFLEDTVVAPEEEASRHDLMRGDIFDQLYDALLSRKNRLGQLSKLEPGKFQAEQVREIGRNYKLLISEMQHLESDLRNVIAAEAPD